MIKTGLSFIGYAARYVYRQTEGVTRIVTSTGYSLLAVYSDSNGAPDELLAVSEETPVDANEGWQTVELISTIEVDEGENIWLTFVFENNPGVHLPR